MATTSTSQPVSADLLDIVCDVASLSTAGEACAALPGLLDRLAAEAGAVACQLDSHAGGPEWTTLSSLAYPRRAADHLGGAFMASWHGRLVLDARGAMRIGEDDVHDFRRSAHYQEVLAPAGFHDGISLALRSNDQRVVGMLHLSACSHRDFRAAVVPSLPRVGKALSRVVQLLGTPLVDLPLPPDFAAVQLVGRDTSWPVAGRTLVVPPIEGELLDLVRTVRETRAPATTFLHRRSETLLEVRVLCSDPVVGEPRCIVATRPARDRLGLTLRQLEVLTAVATGAGNREIAEELCLTSRTVAAHVELILDRLGVATRAGAAAVAVASGLLLPRADRGSVRSLGRIVRRPTVTA